MEASTLGELLALRSQATPEALAYRQFDERAGRWVDHRWGEVARLVERWRAALRREALVAGDRVAVLVPNGLDHVCMDQAALALGLVVVPMHMIDQPESLAYVLADSAAVLLLVDTAEHWRLLQPLAGQLPALRRVVCLAGEPGAEPGPLRSLPDWLAAGAAADTPAGSGAGPAPEALAAIVYTSGTTGRPKGVMLSHRNVLANVYAVLEVVPVQAQDLFLSFLPLSHTLERTAGYYLPMAAGAAVAFARSVQALPQDLLDVRPTVLISVPRIYERAAAAIQEALAARPLARRLFELAVRIGWRRFERGAAPAARPWREPLWWLLERGVARPVRARFGGRLRAAVTGGAPMPQSVARTFLALGIQVLQGYGLTESAPVIACNRPGDNRPDSVGRPLPGIEVRIGARDELLVRGPNVMQGYWQRPQETAQVLDPDGWLHTGDQARLEAGHLYIRGRIKDIIVTSTGEKIAPADVEAAILTDPLFEQAMVIGESRPYIAALVVLNRAHWQQAARDLELPADGAGLDSPVARDWALARIATAVRAIPAYARPRAVSLALTPWTLDAGLMTPTLKPKRLAIERRFAQEIAGLYAGHERPPA